MKSIHQEFLKHVFVGTFFPVIFFFNQFTLAADASGQFGIRGAGLITCKMYESERVARGDVYLMTAAWMDGYITASNEHKADTYDSLSFESTEMLMEVLHKHCEKNLDDIVFTVLKSLLLKLQDDRLRDHSEKIEIAVGGRSVSLYVTLLKRIKQKLALAGLYRGEIDEVYNDEMIRAVKSYQESIGYNPTGFPDQSTLWRLMRTVKTPDTLQAG